MRDHLDQFGDALPAVVTFTVDPTRPTAPTSTSTSPSSPMSTGSCIACSVPVAVRWGRSPGTLMLYARLLCRGRGLHRPSEDTRQLGAGAIIDRSGLLHRLWLPARPNTRPHVDEIIATMQGMDPH